MHRMNDGDVDQPDGEPRGRIKVLLADSHQLLGQALATALQADADLVLVGVRPYLATADLLRARPDVLVVGYAQMVAHRAHLAELRAQLPNLKIIVLAADSHGETVVTCIQAGAVGCVTKGQSPAELARAIKRAHAGEVLFRPETLVGLLWPVRGRRPERAPAPTALAARELEVLRALAEGLKTGEVAERLVISPHTVRTHLKQAMRKLRVGSRMEAVMVAAQEGLIELPDRLPQPGDTRNPPRAAGPGMA
jgi:DNA-binding NarL/FixJ family response regulator